jgi:hypothetical protein
MIALIRPTVPRAWNFGIGSRLGMGTVKETVKDTTKCFPPLIALLVLLLIGALPTWHSCASRGYEPEMMPRAQATATQRTKRPGWID